MLVLKVLHIQHNWVMTCNVCCASVVPFRLFQFYTKVAEAESWINEKKPLLVSSELGRDEDAVQVGGT